MAPRDQEVASTIGRRGVISKKVSGRCSSRPLVKKFCNPLNLSAPEKDQKSVMVNREHVMKCTEVQEHLSAWLDGEVPEELRPRLAEHLATCPACQAELATLERLDAVLAGLEAPGPRPDLAAGVLRRLPRPTSPWVRSLALAACLLLGIFIGGSLTGTFYQGTQVAKANGNGEVVSLEMLQDYPQGSVGGAFFYQADEDNSA